MKSRKAIVAALAATALLAACSSGTKSGSGSGENKSSPSPRWIRFRP